MYKSDFLLFFFMLKIAEMSIIFLTLYGLNLKSKYA